MNVYIYSEMQNKIEKSGVGRAAYHQRRAAALNNLNCVDNMKEADVVHINTVFPKSVLAAFKAHLSGIPVVYHAHSTREDFRNSYIGSNTFSGLFKLWLKFCYSRGDLIVTPSEYSKGLLKNYGIKKEIRVISNGIDLEDYRRNEEAGKEFRVKYGYSENDKVIMSAGLMIRRKGILDFIELAKVCPNINLYGSAPLTLTVWGKT
ncbi:MAG: glycosyltransferase [Clostridiales bacterium]|nr:glycosyltransferase [Clostridiales bacterium]